MRARARQQSYDCHVALRNFRTHADSAQPRNLTLNTRPSFRAGAREGLGTRLARRKPPKKNEWNKWKNHFYEMKGDVGMSLHEKKRNKKMPTPRYKVTHNPIHTSLFLPRLQRTFSCRQLDVKMLCCAVCFAYIMHS